MEHGRDGALKVTMRQLDAISTVACVCGDAFIGVAPTVIEANEEALAKLRGHLEEVRA